MATSTQLTCPHCGSTLTFGMEIATGTPVECLICMQSFAAAPKAAAAAAVATAPIPAASIHGADLPTMSDTATASIPKAAPKAKPAPVAGVQVSKKAPIPTAAKANPDAELPAAPSIRKPAPSSTGGKFALLAIALGLAFLLTGGIVFAIVKITASTRPGAAGVDLQIADNQKAGPDNPAKGIDSGKPDKTNPDKSDPIKAQDSQGSGNAVLTPEEEEQIRNRLKEETKLLLKRKVAVGGGAEPDWQPVATFNVDKQPALGLTQQKINAAIDKGVIYLKNTQDVNGVWNHNHAVGHTAIGGLTLLECQVPANDLAVQRAAAYVRSNCGNLTNTYELSLAIIFLDRLGEARDRTLIQGMAMRLLAGQNDCGGWSYNCPLLTPPEMLQLYNFLHANKKPSLLDPLQGKPPGGTADPLRNPAKVDNPFQDFHELAKNPNPKEPKKVAKNPAKMAPIHPNMLNPSLQKLAIVRNQGAVKGQMMLGRAGGDNSNTQFALLALWAARRHDVPTDPAHLAGFQRFATSQHQDGGWGYHPVGHGSTNTMTCVGLLGLAMGHGASPEIVRFNPKDPKDTVVKPALQDPKIQAGLQALARNIGEPSTAKNPSLPMQNLYFLWSVERVAMLYDLKTIGGKDWYGWGAQILVHNQGAEGAWNQSHYHGANPQLNTCFALLFLKRSNLVQDLTNNLRLYTGIRDTEK